MVRSSWILAAALASATLVPAGSAGAEPMPGCEFTLSLPHVVQVSGNDMVTATLAPTACNRSNSYLTVACLQMQGSDGPGRCAQNSGPLVAQVYLSPYRPGATYVSTGRGCASTGNPPQPVCQPMGPFTVTL
jgi:hypothetical protein